MFNHGSIIGQECKEMGRNGTESGGLGTITNSYIEDGKHWVELDNEYEFSPSKVESVVDLISGLHYIRVYA
jgi:hypothetical protein